MRYVYRTLVTGAAAAALVVGAAVASMATAAADDLPPADPGVPAPPAPMQGIRLPAGAHLGLAQWIRGHLGRSCRRARCCSARQPAPSCRPRRYRTRDPAECRNPRRTQLLLPRNYRTLQGADDPTPSPYDLQTGVPPGPFARVDGLKGVHAMVHGALGRMPADQLGQPLPGTAPAPGITIPAGPVEFLPDPAHRRLPVALPQFPERLLPPRIRHCRYLLRRLRSADRVLVAVSGIVTHQADYGVTRIEARRGMAMSMDDRTLAPKLMLAAAIAVGATLAGPALAAADPGPGDPSIPPAPPVGFIPPNATIGSVLAQAGAPSAGPLGLPDLSGYAPGLLLGQNPVPSAPGAHRAPSRRRICTRSTTNTWCRRTSHPPRPGRASPTSVSARRRSRRARAGWRSCADFTRCIRTARSTARLLGQVPYEQLGEPLPGTAPGPGIYVPPGLGYRPGRSGRTRTAP